MIDLTDTTEVIELLNRAVAEKGADYVYPGAGEECYYFEPDGTPSCIVGHVMAYKGATIHDMNIVLNGAKDETYDVNYGANVQTLSDSRVISVSPDTKDILLTAQRNQDEGNPWGESVHDAVQGGDYR